MRWVYEVDLEVVVELISAVLDYCVDVGEGRLDQVDHGDGTQCFTLRVKGKVKGDVVHSQVCDVDEGRKN